MIHLSFLTFRFRLRTLLIVLAIGPPLVAGGYWTWEWSRPSRRWYYQDGGSYMPPPNKPGYHWKLTNDRGLIEVPIEQD